MLLYLSISLWMTFKYRIEYFFGNPPKERILYLKKEAGENNLSAVSYLMIFYAKQNDDKMFKKYYDYQKELFEYCKENKDKCKGLENFPSFSSLQRSPL